MIEQIFFIIFAALAIISALGVISLRNPVHAALSLIVCFFQIACLFVLLRSPFLAVVQVFIYVGAVMVLFLFVVMILDIKKVSLGVLVTRRSKYIYFFLVGLAIELIVVLTGGFQKLILDTPGEEVKIEVIGRVLFTEFLFPFELVSILLLVAMVGAIIMIKDAEKEGAK
ncbi:MAG: NADH-quinone oxidoreductase subunit J [Deltaproteobacteria bacterium]|nr:NADH-quinone oxidoreductase subunit J [Deltaproteobacteria bacterium]